jgi:hypothetical protein
MLKSALAHPLRPAMGPVANPTNTNLSRNAKWFIENGHGGRSLRWRWSRPEITAMGHGIKLTEEQWNELDRVRLTTDNALCHDLAARQK